MDGYVNDMSSKWRHFSNNLHSCEYDVPWGCTTRRSMFTRPRKTSSEIEGSAPARRPGDPAARRLWTRFARATHQASPRGRVTGAERRNARLHPDWPGREDPDFPGVFHNVSTFHFQASQSQGQAPAFHFHIRFLFLFVFYATPKPNVLFLLFYLF